MDRKYVYNLSVLMPGDILLSTTDGKTGKIVREFTDGPFSHAMLYVGNAVIHAIPKGVVSNNPQRLLFNSAKELRALRFKGGLSNEVMKNVVYEARSLAGHLYSMYEAAATNFHRGKDTPAKSRNQFCSRLIAQCYSNVGLSIVKNPNYCSPNDINRSSNLVEVINAVRKASDSELAIADTEDSGVILEEMTLDWLAKVRNLAVSLHLKETFTINDVTELLIHNPELDEEVSQFVSDSGYLDYFDRDRTINYYRYDANLYLAEWKDSGFIVEIIKGERKINSIDYQRFAENYLIAKLNYKNFGLKYTALHIKLYENLLKEVRVKSKVLREVKSRFLSMNLPRNLIKQ